jgi:MFS family permease
MLDKRHVIIFIGAALGPLGGNAVVTLIPSLMKTYAINEALAASSITFFMVPFAIFQLFSGPISDIYDRNKTVLIGFLAYAMGSLFCALSTTIELFLASRIIQGLGFAWISPVSVAILGDITPWKKRGIAMGWFGTAITTGIATGPLLGGFFAPIWRWAFIIFFILSLVIGAAFWMIFKDQKYDIKKGSFSEIFPKLSKGLSNKNLQFLCVTGFLVFFSYIGVITFLTDALSKNPFHMDYWMPGVIIASSGFSGILASPLAGLAVDKYGRKVTAIVGLFISITILFCLTLSNSFELFILLFLILGCGNAIIWAALTTLSVELLPTHERGTASSLFNSFRFIGYALAPVTLASVYTLAGIKPLYIIGGFVIILCLPLIYLINNESKTK